MAYAIFTAQGHQFRAEMGALLKVPTLPGDPGAKVTFDRVLLSVEDGTVKSGQPTVKGAKVVAEIVRHGKHEKIIVFKFKRRKTYRRKTGHRQGFTEIKVTDLRLG